MAIAIAAVGTWRQLQIEKWPLTIGSVLVGPGGGCLMLYDHHGFLPDGRQTLIVLFADSAN